MRCVPLLFVCLRLGIGAFTGWIFSAVSRPSTDTTSGLRELEVLRLLATDLDGPDIAKQLMVSLNTMRTHTKSIYAKLGVKSRRAAVHRAEELELLSRTATLNHHINHHIW